MKIFLPIIRSLLKLPQHLGIAVNDTKLRELEGGEGSITGLVEKLQQLKESSNSKTVNSVFVFTVFFIL
jgi:hypothetical protein